MAYSTVRALSGFMEMRTQIINAILEHATTLEKDCQNLVKGIDKELNTLRS